MDTDTLLAIEPTYLKKYLEKISNASLEERQKAFETMSTFDLKPELLTFKGDTAFIAIKGRLTNQAPSFISRFFRFDATVYQDIIDAALAVKGNDQIREVRLIMDTPGGTVDMCDETFQVLMELRKTKKVIAICTGMIASAGYYLASAAHEIWATAPTNEVGSIGVIVAFTSWTAYDERLGIKEITIVSKNAPKKAPDIDTPEGQDIILERINATERIFINRVAEGRKITADKIIKDFGQGGVLVAKDPDEEKPDALSVGMIDKLKFEMKIPAAKGDKIKKAGFGMQTDQPDKTLKEPFVADSLKAGPMPKDLNGESTIGSKQAEKKQEDTKNKTNESEGKKMDLHKFLEENPGAKAQYDMAVDKAKSAGYQSGTDKATASAAENVKKVLPFLMGEYPAAVKTLAGEVLSGDVGFEALRGAAAMADATAEAAKAEAAKKETDGTGETPAGAAPTASADGVISTEEDMQASIERVKANG